MTSQVAEVSMIRKIIATTNALLWGITAGVIAGIAAFGYIAGISWIFLFGDDPWPSWSFWFLTSVGIVIGISVTFVVVRLFHVFDSPSKKKPANLGHAGKGHIWKSCAGLVIVILFWGGLSLLYVRNKETEEAQIAIEQKKNQYYRQYLQNKMRLTTISFDRNDVQRKLFAMIHFDGKTPGDYSLRWRVLEDLYGTTLINGKTDLTFPLPGDVYKVELDINQISEIYKSKLTHGQGGFIIGEGSIQFIVDLVPSFTDEDRVLMPSMNLHNFALEVDRLDMGQDAMPSDLITQVKAAVPYDIKVPK
ncbi:MAG: hypothetical protein PHW76_06100 [Alphaproteobacteria bacterium]|nr:hypothetical protein [Alphaproteobacteria bacterium]